MAYSFSSFQNELPFYTRSPMAPPPWAQPPQPDLFGNFFSSQRKNVEEYSGLVSQYAAPLRSLLFQASPELAQTAKFLQSRFETPIPEDLLENYRTNIRSAQIARGFEGGSGPATQEAQYITGLQEQERMNLLPQLQGFGANILGMTGFQGPKEIDFAPYAGAVTEQARTNLAYGQLAQNQYQFQQEFGLAQKRFEQELRAAYEQSAFARRQYFETQSQIDEFGRRNRGPARSGYIPSISVGSLG